MFWELILRLQKLLGKTGRGGVDFLLPQYRIQSYFEAGIPVLDPKIRP